MTAEILSPAPGGRRAADDRPRRHLRLLPPLTEQPQESVRPPRPVGPPPDGPVTPVPLLAPVVPPGTPWPAALAAYAVEPAWQIAVAPVWLVLLGPLLVATSAPVVMVLALVLGLATLALLLVALVRDLADLWALGVATGGRRLRRMLRHAVTLGPWGYLGVRGKRTGDWGPFLAATVVWLLILLTTGTVLLAGVASR